MTATILIATAMVCITAIIITIIKECLYIWL